MNEDKRIIGVVTEDAPNNAPMPIMSMSQRPMILPMRMGMQGNQYPFPLIMFFFPRVALFFMSQRGMPQDQRKIGIRHITQLIRDDKGRIQEIIEITE